MALIKEANGVRDFSDRHVPIRVDQRHRLFQPHAQLPGVRRHADSAFKQFQEPESSEANEKRQILQNDFFGKMRLDEFPNKSQLLRRQGAGDGLRRGLLQTGEQRLQQFQNVGFVHDRIVYPLLKG
ncbi:hypothetical protein [Paraburkholderia dipogonis]|uniref:hypothetical protein n=1 Tax=Paraburkholderia dipogonis TaxID=1211383 RepID=UPI0038B9E124